ncbi:hypothetical protein [Methylobacterium sp. R2-1]|uniref:hypothetical protein n=1 Tax=Methylobacterium sp. R2-1 TaxID=2587064 RepID=UPI00160DEE8C|nr:hypothetical protein [Methylobacterium sp. R2-1]MBB2960383.1 hypothetical protein [Methylobacterium sp. R2-1]
MNETDSQGLWFRPATGASGNLCNPTECSLSTDAHPMGARHGAHTGRSDPPERAKILFASRLPSVD